MLGLTQPEINFVANLFSIGLKPYWGNLQGAVPNLLGLFDTYALVIGSNLPKSIGKHHKILPFILKIMREKPDIFISGLKTRIAI